MIQRRSEEAGYQNMLSRSAIYPASDMQRLPVPGDMVSWQVDLITKFKFLVTQLRNHIKWHPCKNLETRKSVSKLNKFR